MDQTLTYILHEVVHLLDKSAEADLKPFNITYNRFRVLRAIGIEASPTQHAIAQKLGYTDASISRMLGILQDRGYITIATDQTHGRKRIVALTPAGAKLVEACNAYLQQEFSDFLAALHIDAAAYAKQSALIAHGLRKRLEEKE